MYNTIARQIDQTTATGNTSPMSAGFVGGYRTNTAPPTPNGLLASALGDLDSRLKVLEEAISGFSCQLGPVLTSSTPTPCCESAEQPSAEILRIVDQISNRVATQTEIVRELSRRLVV